MYNLILDIDSYKASHYNQYPPHTQQISSYIESRGGKFSHIIFFGLQRFIKKYLTKPITQADIDEAEQVLIAHGLPFNRNGWQYILEQYQGYIPIKIQAVKEGTILPTSNVLVQITNTDDNCYWLTSYLETALLRSVWYPTTVATVSLRCKQIIYNSLKQTSTLKEDDLHQQLAFKLHDFGARGASSRETSAIGGLAHLINFQGTDSVLSLLEAQKYYHCDMAGFSIPAAEHSTITTWGKNKEEQSFHTMIDTYLQPNKALSIVCDTYNFENAIKNIIGYPSLKNKIIHSNGTLVIRPDSGNPVDIILESLELLEEIFGVEFNSAGFKVLPPYIRIIQGDGVNSDSILAICNTMEEYGYSIENIAFGMGAELQQKVNRDTCKFAMKASAIRIDNQWYDCFKSPITDPGKTSKPGILKLINRDGKYLTVRADDPEYYHDQDLLEVVFENGKIIRDQSLSEIRTLAEQALEITIEV